MSRYTIQVCDLCKKEARENIAKDVWEFYNIDVGDGRTARVQMCHECEKDFIELRDTHYAEMRTFLGKFGFKDRT